MAKKSSTHWNESDLESRGYVKQLDGSWAPPAMKSKFIQGLSKKQHLYENETIIEKSPAIKTPDFDYTPKTEWFITYNVPSKKNSRINLKSGISIPSKKHSEYVKLTEMQYEVFGREFRGSVEFYKLKPPYRIEFTFVRQSHHSFDYCNACQTCEDMMKDQYKAKRLVRKGWFDDDSADYIRPFFGEYRYDKNNPGVIIKLLK